MLRDKNVLIGITGSIAAFKIPLLVRLLVKEEANVRLIMTPAAKDFVTPLTLSTLSKHPVWSESFDAKDGSWNSHVDLGRWADVFLVAPASANTLAKMAHGIADNFLMAVYLSAKCPVYFAPAMDLDMYKHPTTQANIKALSKIGHTLIEPQTGELASGLCGAGRMEEPEAILETLRSAFTEKDMEGIRAMVTAGPTFEAIDPVRFLGNHSTGRMGIALAENLARRGALVSLVCGPIHLETRQSGINRINVVSASEMYEAVMKLADQNDVIIMAAAVADFRPEQYAIHKIKKNIGGNPELKLVETTDILAQLGKIKKADQILVGFALETSNEKENARKKLNNKKADLIVLNSLNDKGAGFGSPDNKIVIFSKDGTEKEFQLKPKEEVAEDIITEILREFSGPAQ